MVYPGGIAESNTRNAIIAFLEVALLESDILPVVDKKCRPAVILLESETTVKKMDIPDVPEVPCVCRNATHLARKPLVVFFGCQ